MNQYSETRKIPRLLKTTESTEASFRVLNGMVELEIGGERTVVPTAEAFNRLLKRIAVLEQRIGNTDNKLSQVRRGKE
jgi:hypothetical protein